MKMELELEMELEDLVLEEAGDPSLRRQREMGIRMELEVRVM